MRFEFPLEGLLKVRRLVEEQALHKLEHSISRLQTIEVEILNAKRLVRTAEYRIAQCAALPAAELQFLQSVLDRHREAIADAEKQRVTEEQTTQTLRLQYVNTKRQRESISRLREHGLEEFKKQVARREQARLDEVFLANRIHSDR